MLGASFDTTNLGVSALAEASIKCIFTQWPNAELILRTSEDNEPLQFHYSNRCFEVKKRNLWFSYNPLNHNNVTILIVCAVLLKIAPLRWLRKLLKTRNSYLKEILDADLAVDITAGDSFSDIYGKRVFIRHSLIKILFLLCDIPLVMLPQTYGPFQSFATRSIARFLLKKASVS